MVLGPAYRGHAPVTFDTVTAQAIVDEVNAHTANAGIHGGGGGGSYAVSTFADVYMSAGGGTTAQSIPHGSFEQLRPNVKASDVSNLYNTSSWYYTVPSSGLYSCSAQVRCRDNQWNNVNGDNLGVGIRAAAEPNGGPSFMWYKVQTLAAGGGRYAALFYRVAYFSTGDPLMLYVYQDSGSTRDLYSAAMQIYRVG